MARLTRTIRHRFPLEWIAIVLIAGLLLAVGTGAYSIQQATPDKQLVSHFKTSSASVPVHSIFTVPQLPQEAIQFNLAPLPEPTQHKAVPQQTPSMQTPPISVSTQPAVSQSTKMQKIAVSSKKPEIPTIEVEWRDITPPTTHQIEGIIIPVSDESILYGVETIDGNYYRAWETRDNGDNWILLGALRRTAKIVTMQKNPETGIMEAHVQEGNTRFDGVWKEFPKNRNTWKDHPMGWGPWQEHFQKQMEQGLDNPGGAREDAGRLAQEMLRDGNLLFVAAARIEFPREKGSSYRLVERNANGDETWINESPDLTSSYRLLVSLDLGETWTEVKQPPLRPLAGIQEGIGGVVQREHSIHIFLLTSEHRLLHTEIPISRLERPPH